MADCGDTSFGTLLRRCRGARGLTQAGLAEKAGLSEQAISALERGARRAPRITTVELLAEALKLDGPEREALRAAAQRAASPAQPRVERAAGRGRTRSRAGGPRWRRSGAALGAILLTGLIIAASPTWWRAREVATAPVAQLVGARVLNWPSANRDVGPLQTQRVYHRSLPASFVGTAESRLPAGVVPIVSYRAGTTNVVSYVRSVDRRTILIFQYNPEARMSATAFASAFEEQSKLIHSVRNPNVRVAMSSLVYQYQSDVNVPAVRCGYIPPPAYVDYYLAAVYDPYLQGITRTDRGGFVTWQRCTSGRHRPRGLVEYGLGLGIQGSGACQPESERTDVMRGDMRYLHDNLPDLAILEYWWTTKASSPPCPRSWQFAAGSSTGDLWRSIASRASGSPSKRAGARSGL